MNHLTQDEITALAEQAEVCADQECPSAHHAKSAEAEASQYRYGVEEALDYIDDRDGITPEVAATLRGILARAIEPRRR
ncbi:hypothetical protein [Streptomyces sp. NPDC005167]